MSKKLAALKVYCLWSWLERNPGRHKSGYPLFKELEINKSKNQCPWCDIWWHRRCRSWRSMCPLYRVGEGCIHTDSLFYTWYYSKDLEDKARVAGEIARIAWEEYKRLGG